jgi:hypothetical protein
MGKSVLKLSSSDENMTLDIYENEPGKLVIDLFSVDSEDNQSGGSITVDTESFFQSLQKLLDK